MRKTEFTSEDFNTAYDYAQEHFTVGLFSIHSFLWNIIINDSLKGKKVVFYYQDIDGDIELVIANSNGGYNRSGLYFLAFDFEKVSEICMQLTFLVWNIGLEEAIEIISESMEYVECELG